MQLDFEGWLKNATIIKSPNYNDRPQGMSIDLLVIHCISLPEGKYDNDYVQALFLNTLDCSSDRGFMTLKNLRVSSHFYIKRDGEIIQFVSTEKRAWHAGVSSYKGRENCNDFSIGIELEGTDKTTFTNKQYQSSITLTKAIIQKYPKVQGNIMGHSDIAPMRKTDPGIGFDWQYFLTKTK